jgi:hypothetical protein
MILKIVLNVNVKGVIPGLTVASTAPHVTLCFGLIFVKYSWDTEISHPAEHLDIGFYKCFIKQFTYITC